MPYYRAGDYYRGDYYQAGGFLGSIGKALGGIAKRVVGGAVGLVTGGPVGAIAGAIPEARRLIGAGINERVIATGRNLLIGPTLGGVAEQGVQMIQAPLQISGGGGGGTMNYPGTNGGGTALMACPTKGMRTNKSTYVTRGGGTSRWPQEIIVHPKGTECVKTRRMNVTNPRALRRALRRAQGFAKLARRFVTVTKKFKKGKRRR